jgi:hypothetical protein
LRPLRRARSLKVALALAALTLAACGGSDDAGTTATRTFEVSEVQHFTCTEWEGADDATQQSILDALRAVTAGPVTGRGHHGQGSVLTDERARQIFDGQCSNDYARGFLLYKLYGQAAGFVGVPP